MINFERDIFDYIVDNHLGYSPKIECKPAHLANGLFRAICGTYANAQEQHQILFPKAYLELPASLHDNELSDPKYSQVRELLYSLFAADGTVFKSVNNSSYTLSHASHITSDNHDRKTGAWLTHILTHSQMNASNLAYELVRNALTQTAWKRSDEFSVLTLPFVETDSETLHPFSQDTSLNCKSVAVDSNGTFIDPLIEDIRTGFDRLAAYDSEYVLLGNKLDLLRRFTLWGCIAVYLHLANSGREDLADRLPLVLTFLRPVPPTLQQASMQSYQWVSRSLDKFFRNALLDVIEDWSTSGTKGAWETDADIEKQINDMGWKTPRRINPERQSTDYDPEFRQRCLVFYGSYRSGIEKLAPRQAFANAVTDMVDVVLSSNPSAVASRLGVRIGLLPSARTMTEKIYAPVPDLLEVLIRASIPYGEQWSTAELAGYWADHYGIVFGGLGKENQLLDHWGIQPVDGTAFRANAEALEDILVMSGLARRYADGIVRIAGAP